MNKMDTTSPPTGNDEKKSKLIIECKQTDKAKWVRYCADHGIKLVDLVIDTLNEKVK